MAKWEYLRVAYNKPTIWVNGKDIGLKEKKKIRPKTIYPELTKLLNHLGSQGWEMVGTSTDGYPDYNSYFVFKRAIK